MRGGRTDCYADWQPTGGTFEGCCDDSGSLGVGQLRSLPEDAEDGHAVDLMTDDKVGKRPQRIEVKLLVTYVNKGADPYLEPPRVKVGGSDDEDAPLTFAY